MNPAVQTAAPSGAAIIHSTPERKLRYKRAHVEVRFPNLAPAHLNVTAYADGCRAAVALARAIDRALRHPRVRGRRIDQVRIDAYISDAPENRGAGEKGAA